MEKTHKFLNKLDKKTRLVIEGIIRKLHQKDFSNLDIKKLKGEQNFFRVRKGDVRIIYTIGSNGIQILKIEFRNDTTY